MTHGAAPSLRQRLASLPLLRRSVLDPVRCARLPDTARWPSVARREGVGPLLAALGEHRGPAALPSLWPRLTGLDPRPLHAGSRGGELLALAAHLGEWESATSIAARLRRLPRAHRAYWLATAAQRAGDTLTARDIFSELDPRRLPDPLRARVETRLARPLEAAPMPGDLPDVDALRVVLRRRVYARETLATFGGAGGARSLPALTLGTTAAMGAAYALQRHASELSPAALASMGAVRAPARWPDDLWRLAAYAFVHVDGVHLAVNALGLLALGRWVERRVGAARAAAVMLSATVGAGLASATLSPAGTLVAGASGLVFGLAAATAAQVARDPSLRSTPEGREELTLLAVALGLHLLHDLDAPLVSASAHGGGMLAGAVVGSLVRPRSSPALQRGA